MMILDFYVDEPACFGVPPYLSPYVRYVAGAAVDAGERDESVHYLSVDSWRKNRYELPYDDEVCVVIAGSTVPGKYLGGKIGTLKELIDLLDIRARCQKGGVTLIGGPVRHAASEWRKKIHESGGILIHGDIEFYVYRTIMLQKLSSSCEYKHWLESLYHAQEKCLNDDALSSELRLKRSYDDADRWSVKGAFIASIHPSMPYTIAELESYRGCTRDVYCSFCSEAMYGRPSFRSTKGIADEVRELAHHHVQHFRIGRQADLLTYSAIESDRKRSFPRPNPNALEELYVGIRSAAPDLKMLHLDNINPALFSLFPDESSAILKTICKYNTAGDTAAMGIESVDENVIRLNSLKCSEEEALLAVRMIHEHGSARSSGVPKLLPGLNFIQGLAGESENTFEKNYKFLKQILDEGLMIRRINIRQVHVHHRSPLASLLHDEEKLKSIPRKKRHPDLLEKKFNYYKNIIRKEIDHPMLLRVFPAGTILREVVLEFKNQGYYFGRPCGSYPVTVKIPADDRYAEEIWNTHRVCDVILTGASERSVTGLTYPVKFHKLAALALESIPGIGRKRANMLITLRGKDRIHSALQLREALDMTLPFQDEDWDFS